MLGMERVWAPPENAIKIISKCLFLCLGLTLWQHLDFLTNSLLMFTPESFNIRSVQWFLTTLWEPVMYFNQLFGAVRKSWSKYTTGTTSAPLAFIKLVPYPPPPKKKIKFTNVIGWKFILSSNIYKSSNLINFNLLKISCWQPLKSWVGQLVEQNIQMLFCRPPV